jgi:hypothetical protein
MIAGGLVALGDHFPQSFGNILAWSNSAPGGHVIRPSPLIGSKPLLCEFIAVGSRPLHPYPRLAWITRYA